MGKNLFQQQSMVELAEHEISDQEAEKKVIYEEEPEDLSDEID